MSKTSISDDSLTGGKGSLEALGASCQLPSLLLSRTLLASTLDPILLAERESGQLVYANPAAENMIGKSASEICQSKIHEIHPPESMDYVLDMFAKSIKAQLDLNKDVPILHSSGRVTFYDIRTRPIEIESGEYLLGSFRDVTDRRQVESEMQRLTAAVNGMGESVVITDPKGIIQYANPCFEKLMGYSMAEIKGKPIGDFKSGQHDKAFYDNIWKTLDKGNAWTGSFINKRKDGSLFEEYANIAPICDVAGKVVHYVAVKRDMTHERDLERRMMHSQKMAALGQFAHRIAHDVTNNLSVILGSAEIIERTSGEEENKYLAQEIKSAIERIVTMNGNLMAFASPGRASVRRCHLDTIVMGMEMMIRRAGAPAVDFEFDMRDRCSVNVDFEKIEQVLMHLIVNASESIEKHGKVHISVYNGFMPESMLATIDNSERKKVPAGILEISDNGIGMTDEECDKVFEPFFSTKKDVRRNAGLGLATVYGIISRHEGDITIRSVQGSGTTVKISLPLIDN